MIERYEEEIRQLKAEIARLEGLLALPADQDTEDVREDVLTGIPIGAKVGFLNVGELPAVVFPGRCERCRRKMKYGKLLITEEGDHIYGSTCWKKMRDAASIAVVAGSQQRFEEVRAMAL